MPMFDTKTKSIYFVATKDGKYPTNPVRRASDTKNHLSISKKFKPDEDWKVFSLERKTITDHEKIRVTDPELSGNDKPLTDLILSQLKTRFQNSKLLREFLA